MSFEASTQSHLIRDKLAARRRLSLGTIEFTLFRYVHILFLERFINTTITIIGEIGL